MRIEVQGHTDNKGAAAYNLKLSDRRAASVKKYLVAHGIPADRLVSHGYGMTRPLVPNDTEQNRALNRRVQFIRTEGGQSLPRRNCSCRTARLPRGEFPWIVVFAAG